MNNRIRKTVALLVLLPLPILGGCEDDGIGPCGDKVERCGGVFRYEPGPALTLQPHMIALAPGGRVQIEAVLQTGGGMGLALPPDEVLWGMEWAGDGDEIIRDLGEGLFEAEDLGEILISARYQDLTARAWVLVTEDGNILPGGEGDSLGGERIFPGVGR